MREFILSLIEWDYSYRVHSNCITVAFGILACAEDFIEEYKKQFPDLEFTWETIFYGFLVRISD